jgi:hypothetical protein
MPLPWAEILRHGPAIVEAAHGLFANQTKKRQERHQSVDVRIDQLENASVESARLLQELAQQVQALSLAEQELQKRMQLALIVGGIGIALGVGAAILALVK